MSIPKSRAKKMTREKKEQFFDEKSFLTWILNNTELKRPKCGEDIKNEREQNKTTIFLAGTLEEITGNH